ncbi:MAG: CDP-alcohol phosphatidyltransferase family protein [Dehalococcoidia bacterium]|nr:CDP-alcohol phosphatidyltransferase family protein [Dehalococcoidia bacterium]
MLNKARRSLAQRVNKIPAELVAKTRISPNIVTALGLLVALVTAWVLSTGHFFLGGFLVLGSGAFDMLDGAVARISGRSTRFGAILDSTFDRLSEAALFLGLLAYYANQGSFQEVVLVGAALVGSMMTSYVRARAEVLGLKCEVGLFTRPERVILLAIGLIFNQMLVILWIIAVLSNLVAWQRLFYVWQQLRKACKEED